jgi:hypothetical protein
MCACEQTHSAEAAMLINSRSYHDHPLGRVRRDYGGSSMPVDARDVATDLNRMDDDGGRLRHPVLTSTLRLAPGPATARQQRTDANHPATSVNATHDWYRQLGASHRRRDESVRLSALAMQQRDQAQQLACDRRWPAVVEAMRALIDSYNDGIGGKALRLVDTGGESGELTATVTAPSGRALVMAVEDADLWVRASQDGNGRSHGERWIGLRRTDQDTADYVLQNWLAQLEPCDSAICVQSAPSITREQG